METMARQTVGQRRSYSLLSITVERGTIIGCGSVCLFCCCCFFFFCFFGERKRFADVEEEELSVPLYVHMIDVRFHFRFVSVS